MDTADKIIYIEYMLYNTKISIEYLHKLSDRALDILIYIIDNEYSAVVNNLPNQVSFEKTYPNHMTVSISIPELDLESEEFSMHFDDDHAITIGTIDVLFLEEMKRAIEFFNAIINNRNNK